MEFSGKLKLNSKSKLYLTGFGICVLVLFIIVALVFWAVIKNYGSQSPQETYSYFLMMVDRWLFILILLGFLPLSVYQWTIKNKSAGDTVVSIAAGILLAGVLIVFCSGQSYFMQKYKSGELSHSEIFCKPSVETFVFDTIIRFQGETPPAMCLPSEKTKKD